MTPVRIRRVEESWTGGPPESPAELLDRLYARRGEHDARGELGLDGLLPFDRFKDIEAAAELLADRLCRGDAILVVGDYDADGATGSALAVLGLRALGAAAVSYLVPSRFRYGYGLGPAVVDAAAELRPSLIVTVDNGTASVAGIARARELGIPVLVTDHHLPGAELPEAAAIVNPNQPGCAFPSKCIAGVGVMFYVLAALRARLRSRGWFGPTRREPNLASLLDLVALGTVADVVTLDRNNRILVEQGLRRIRAGAGRAGIRALIQVAGRDPAQAIANSLGFCAGPRLNAAGRLGEMSLGVECLLADDPVRALEIATRLDAVNRERREIEANMRGEAEYLVERLTFTGDAVPPALCLFGRGWHEGVAGIVASRVRERWNRPVIAFAEGADGLLKGSGRSVDALNIRDAIDAVDRANPGLILRFGGHAMAAGLTLERASLGAFRKAFAEAVRTELGDQEPVREIHSDGELPLPLLSLETAEALRRAGPWGKGFPEPTFDGEFAVTSVRMLKDSHLKLRVRPPRGPVLDAIAFNQAERLRAAESGQVRVAYRLEVNEYLGRRSPQLLLEHLQSTT